MRPILDSRISFDFGKWSTVCACGKKSLYAAKNSALKMLEKGSCRFCSKRHSKINTEYSIYQREDGRWCSSCSSCGIEQAYTRKDHAKQSSVNDWQCKGCISKLKGFSENASVGDRARTFNRFKKSAESRSIDWQLTEDQMFSSYTGKCQLTGWDIGITYSDQTASLDRIDSKKPYELENTQWVHTMVNMCKNKYDQDKFIDMCVAIANKVKW
jgi:hypothetical protein